MATKEQILGPKINPENCFNYQTIGDKKICGEIEKNCVCQSHYLNCQNYECLKNNHGGKK